MADRRAGDVGTLETIDGQSLTSEQISAVSSSALRRVLTGLVEDRDRPVGERLDGHSDHLAATPPRKLLGARDTAPAG